MEEDWIVRVGEKEYGPVSLETLLEWRGEGRLIRENEIRPAESEEWVTAGSVADLFPPAIEPGAAGEGMGRRGTFGQYLRMTFLVYRRGFGRFFALMLLVSVPSFVFQIGLLLMDVGDGKSVSAQSIVGTALLLLAAACLIVAWPISIAGLQLTAADVMQGKRSALRDILRRSFRLWTRMARLCLLVYTTYFFWTVIPLFAVALVTGTDPSAGSLLWAVAILLLMAYMLGRLFINFLFWQPAGALNDEGGPAALLESKFLARTRPTNRRLDWPLYRGIVVATVWMLVLLAISIAVELPFVVMRLQGVANFDDPMALLRELTNPKTPNFMTIASYALTSLLHALLRPLLASAIVVLYLQAKAEQVPPRAN